MGIPETGGSIDKDASKANNRATTTNPGPPELATRRNSETTILKIVEKRIRDGAMYQQQQDDKAEAGSAGVLENSSSFVPPTNLIPALTSAADMDYLDTLTIQKVVNASLGVGVANNVRQEERGDTDKKVDEDPAGKHNCYLSPEQQLAASGKPKDKEGKGEVVMAGGLGFQDAALPQPHLNRGGGDLVVGSQNQRPGAYQGIPGAEPVRTLKPRYSALGRESDETRGMAQDVAAAIREVGAEDLTDDHADVEEGTPRATTTTEQRRSLLTNSSSNALSVATLVPDGSSAFALPLPVAREFGSSRELSKGGEDNGEERDQKKKKQRMIMGSIAVILPITALVLLLVFLLGPESKSDPNETSAIGTTEIAETAPPTLSPEAYVLSLLPASTARIVGLGLESPQSKAYQWILGDPNLLSYTAERLQQRYALATFYFSTSGPMWKNQTNWLSFTDHECTWFHRNYFEDVELYMASSTAHTFKLMYNSDTYPCSHNTTGSFEHLWIYKNGLEGRLPLEELSLLTSLKSMALFGNQLEITLSSELGKLRALEGIEFSSLDVDGTIPTQIGLLTNLRAILASSNQITGTIPTQYGLLSKLEYSMLSKNQLSGSLPKELGMMSSLAWLYLYGNQITGSIPSVLGQVTTFEFLNMYTNQLTGSLPTQIGQLTRMNLMALSDNFLTGELPSELGRLTNVKQGLSLNRNQFVGTIPTQMGAITGITGTITGSGTYGLGLGGNRLTGKLPSELGKLSLLERLYVEDNELTGPLPSELGSMTMMGTLGAQNNQFTGEVPIREMLQILQALNTSSHHANDLESWNVLESIEWDLSGNRLLSGTVPSFFCEALVFDCSDWLCGCDCNCSAF